ncbi:S-adenosyl-L-methionine-dependent methyltransferase [Hysterangium stoloniferum]|nr:S-adenosyl-L-methionine-dependent methyltransferase [Hysterangium stoloniferum]
MAMAPLTHPSIRDGWFKEISSQWPRMAMTLKVVKILHVEYQDVLVFLKRDEFSYQEMIPHIPLASHPNPKKVLVIGGGDGGVAVVRVSKQYLPHMSSLLDTSRVRVYVGDGFKFLADNKSTYDVIITDSSDPVGPAAALFEQSSSYTTPSHPAATSLPGRVTRKIFPVVEYAYITIPTYPAGQIGFIVASKQPGRDLSKPLRPVPNTRYYNSALHTAAFTLPEFARVILDTGKNILPVLGPQAPANATPRKPQSTSPAARPTASPSHEGWLKEGMTWAEVGAKIVGAKEASESAILAAIASLLPGDKNTRDQVVSGLRWIGLLGAEKATVRATLFDTLCARLEELMRYEQGEQDMIVLQHRFGVQWKDGGEETLTSTLITYGNPLPGGYTAMALTVGLPCGIATQLVLDGEIKTKGVCTPYFGHRADGSKYAGSSKEARDMCELLRVKLEEEGVGCVEGKL